MSEETIKEMRERHDKEISEFREACPHKKISGWMPYEWAPGHQSGFVKVCERCEKTMESKSADNAVATTFTSSEVLLEDPPKIDPEDLRKPMDF